MKIFQFPVISPPHIAYITDRPRNSGLTSVRFVSQDKVVCCDFNEKMMYLAKLKGDGVEILDSCPTVIQDGTPVETDLLDVRDNLLVVTNFYQGSLSFYRLQNDRITFSHELNTNDFVGIHGVRFVPGVENVLWISYCGAKNKCFELVDYKTGTLIRRVWVDEQMQDVAFLGGYALACARTNHITRSLKKSSLWARLRHGKRMYSTVYLYRMPQDIYVDEPVLIDTWHCKGHLDAFIEFRGRAHAANQYCDRIDVFSVKRDRICLEETIGGFGMPHGIDIRSDGLMAVTNYSDQTLRLGFLPDGEVNPYRRIYKRVCEGVMSRMKLFSKFSKYRGEEKRA
jgi:hypothetical protein